MKKLLALILTVSFIMLCGGCDFTTHNRPTSYPLINTYFDQFLREFKKDEDEAVDKYVGEYYQALVDIEDILEDTFVATASTEKGAKIKIIGVLSDKEAQDVLSYHVINKTVLVRGKITEMSATYKNIIMKMDIYEIVLWYSLP